MRLPRWRNFWAAAALFALAAAVCSPTVQMKNITDVTNGYVELQLSAAEYLPSKTCVWSVTAPKGYVHQINVQFYFDGPSSDRVTIYEGRNNTNPANVLGVYYSSSDSFNRELYSTTSNITIVVQTDALPKFPLGPASGNYYASPYGQPANWPYQFYLCTSLVTAPPTHCKGLNISLNATTSDFFQEPSSWGSTPYIANTTCGFLVSAGPSQIVMVQIQTYYIKARDYLIAYDGRNRSAPLLPQTANNAQGSTTFMSSGSYLYLLFDSAPGEKGQPSNLYGFTISTSALPGPQQCLPVQTINVNMSVTNCGMVGAPNPAARDSWRSIGYLFNRTCQWRIVGPVNSSILITTQYFCLYPGDYILLYDGNTTASPLIGNTSDTGTIYAQATHGVALLVFKANSLSATSMLSQWYWSFNYYVHTQCTGFTRNLVYGADPVDISSYLPNDQNGCYTGPRSCRFLLIAPGNNRTRLYINSMSLAPGDNITIVDINTKNTTLAVLTDSSCCQTFFSSGPRMLVVINVNRPSAPDECWTGLSASASVVVQPPACTPVVMPAAVCDYFYFPLLSDGSWDNNTPYRVNTTCTFNLTAPPGYNVDLSVYNYNFGPNHTLSIHDGPNASSPLIGVLTGTGCCEYDIVSSSSSMFLVMDTRGGVLSGTGFYGYKSYTSASPPYCGSDVLLSGTNTYWYGAGPTRFTNCTVRYTPPYGVSYVYFSGLSGDFRMLVYGGDIGGPLLLDCSGDFCVQSWVEYSGPVVARFTTGFLLNGLSQFRVGAYVSRSNPSSYCPPLTNFSSIAPGASMYFGAMSDECNPNTNYQAGSCAWVITAPTNTLVQLYINYPSIDYLAGTVRIYAGDSASAPLIQAVNSTFQGLLHNQFIISGTAFISESFPVPNGRLEVPAMYFTTVSTPVIFCAGPKTLSASPTRLEEEAVLNGQNYFGPNMSCSWLVTALGETDLVYIRLEGCLMANMSVVRVYDGPNSSSPEIVDFDSTLTSSYSFCSTGRSVFIEFEAVGQSGAVIAPNNEYFYFCYNSEPGPSVTPTNLPNIISNCTNTPIRIQWGMGPNAGYIFFSTPNLDGPYARNLNCTVIVTAPLGLGLGFSASGQVGSGDKLVVTEANRLLGQSYPGNFQFSGRALCSSLQISFTSDAVTEEGESVVYLQIYQWSYDSGVIPLECRPSLTSGICGNIVFRTLADAVAYNTCALVSNLQVNIANYSIASVLTVTGCVRLNAAAGTGVGYLDFPRLTNVCRLYFCSTLITNVSMPLVQEMNQISGSATGTTLFLANLTFVSSIQVQNDILGLVLPKLAYTNCLRIQYSTVFNNLVLGARPWIQDIYLEGLVSLTALNLTSVTGLQCIYILSSGLTIVDLSPFTSLSQITINYNPKLSIIRLDNLQSSGNCITFQGNGQLTTIFAPVLEAADDMEISGAAVVTIDLPKLRVVDDICFDSNPSLVNINLPQLVSVDCFDLNGSPIRSLSLPSLIQFDDIYLSSLSRLSTLDMCSIVEGNCVSLSATPSLSCYDTVALFNYTTNSVNYEALDCDDSLFGQFGCDYNETRTLNPACNSLSCIQFQIDLCVKDHHMSVYVPAGTYTGCADGPLNLKDKTVTLYGAGPGQTVIDCQGSGQALIADQPLSGATVVRGMSFRNGAATNGGLVSLTGAASPSFTDCTFEGGVASALGGGLYVGPSSSPVLTNCSFVNNRAATGGGIAVVGGTAVLFGCSVTTNTASEQGGGVSLSATLGAVPALTGCTLSGNTAPRGGGLFVDGPLVAADCTLSGNNGQLFGGGLAAVPINAIGTWCNLTWMIIENNLSPSGGGIYSFSANLQLSGSLITSNSAGTSGGGGLYGACSENYRFLNGIRGPCDVYLLVSDSLISGNDANGAGGGALMRYVQFETTGVNFTDNMAVGSGGGIYVSHSIITARGGLIDGNTAMQSGGGMFCEPLTGSCDVSGTSFADNAAGVGGGGVFLCAAGCPGVNYTTGSAIQFAALPNLKATNTFARNAINSDIGYGSDIASDPSRLSFLVPPAPTAVSGRSLVNASSAAVTVLVTDNYGQTVTTYTSVLALTLVPLLPGGGSAQDQVAVSGPRTVLSRRGVGVFDGVSLVASSLNYASGDYVLSARLALFPSVAISASVQLMPCMPGQGKPAATTAVTCLDCAAGTAGTGAGTYTCDACAPGTYAASALATVCTPCPVNTNAPTAGSAVCIECPVGYSAPTEGSAQCTQGATDAVTDITSLAAPLGASVGVILVLVIVAAFVVWRLARKRTMKKYYLDQDSTIRSGAIETPLQRNVKKMVVAASTTRIGGGVYSDVYKARYENRWIALKVLKSEMLGNSVALKEFQRETLALNRLNERKHPGIVKLQFFSQKKPMCIGIEFCPNGTVKAAITGKLQMADKIRWIAEAASGMAVLHSLNIAHLDLKTDNLLLDSENHIKLADFGISRTQGMEHMSMPTEYVDTSLDSASGDSPGSYAAMSAMGGINPMMNPVFASHGSSGSGTGSAAGAPRGVYASMAGLGALSTMSGPGGLGTMIGVASMASNLVPDYDDADSAYTPQYVDPARIDFERGDIEFLKQADVFSFSMVMWAVMGQEEPYAGEDPLTLVAQLKANPELRPAKLSDCPSYYDKLMRRCWSSDRQSRPIFRTIMEEMQRALRHEFATELLEGYANPDDTVYASVHNGPSAADAPVVARAEGVKVDGSALDSMMMGSIAPATDNVHSGGALRTTRGNSELDSMMMRPVDSTTVSIAPKPMRPANRPAPPPKT